MKILIFDTETSGLPEERNCSVLSLHKWPYIVQLAYILYDTDTNTILDYNDTLINISDDVYISPESINIHKITREMCNEKGENIRQVLNRFNNVLLETDLIVGHNLQFDKNIIMVEFLRNRMLHNFNPNNIIKPTFCTMENGKSICKLTYKNKYGNLVAKYPKLLELFKYYFDYIPEGLHNAMCDVIITLRCYYKMQFDSDILELSLDMKKLTNLYFTPLNI